MRWSFCFQMYFIPIFCSFVLDSLFVLFNSNGYRVIDAGKESAKVYVKPAMFRPFFPHFVRRLLSFTPATLIHEYIRVLEYDRFVTSYRSRTLNCHSRLEMRKRREKTKHKNRIMNKCWQLIFISYENTNSTCPPHGRET